MKGNARTHTHASNARKEWERNVTGISKGKKKQQEAQDHSQEETMPHQWTLNVRHSCLAPRQINSRALVCKQIENRIKFKSRTAPVY